MKKRILSLMLAMMLCLSLVPTVAFAVEFPKEGPTVVPDPDSPTGYTVQFVYRNTTATSVIFAGNVSLSNDCDRTDTKQYSPFEYKPGLMRSGQFEAPMENLGDGYWYYELPLCAGANIYWFKINGVNTPDPANPPALSPTSSTHDLFSVVYVPYDEKQDYAPLKERTAENPRNSKCGTWSYLYLNSFSHCIGVYLPYAYDPDRYEPYKTIYLLHAGAQDESLWLENGSAHNIMDNLAADGKTESAVIVTAFQDDLGTSENNYSGLYNTLIPFIEAHYNVSNNKMDRAVGGVSVGGMHINEIINGDAVNTTGVPIDKFGYYGLWSGGCYVQSDFPGQEYAHIMFGGADNDIGNPSVTKIQELAAQGVACKYVQVTGAHTWNTWSQLFRIWLENYLWDQEAYFNTEPILTANTDKSSYIVGEMIKITGSLKDCFGTPLAFYDVACANRTSYTFDDGNYTINIQAKLTDDNLASEEVTLKVEFAGDEEYTPAYAEVTCTVSNAYNVVFDPNTAHGGDAYIGNRGGYDPQRMYFVCGREETMINPDREHSPFFDGIYYAKYVNGRQYVFIGWSEDPNATVPTYKAGDTFTDLTTPNEPITLYAIWDEPIYITRVDATVTPPAADSTPNYNASVTVQPNGVNIAEIDGAPDIQIIWYKSSDMAYDYDAWTEMNSGEHFEEGYYYLAVIHASFDSLLTESTAGYINGERTDERFSSLYSPNMPFDAMLFRTWYLPKNHTVVFDMGGHGTQIAQQIIEDGGKATMPAVAPSEDRYSFEGWYADATFNVGFDFNSPIIADTTVYAKWKQVSTDPSVIVPTAAAYKVVHHVEELDGSYSVKETEQFVGELGKEVTAAEKSYAHYTFNSAKSSKTGTVVMPSVENGELVLFTLDLYYDLDTYDVTFEMNGHGTQVDSQSVKHGGSATEPAEPFESNFTFEGWYADATFSSKFDFDTSIVSDTVVYAKWIKDAVTPIEPTPQTGDNSNMPLWITLLFISGSTLTGIIAYSKRKIRAK